MTPDDLFRLEVVSAVAVSPAGDSVAYVVQRPSASASRFAQEYLAGNDRGDVWIASVKTGSSKRITNGEADGAGFWDPSWSPDGQSIAMLSTRGQNIKVWVWSKSSGHLESVSDRGVSSWSDPFVWVSEHQLLFWALPEGERSLSMTLDSAVPDRAGHEWAKVSGGQEITASVLESGIQGSRDTQSQATLLLTDLSNGKSEVVSTTSGYGDYSFATLRVAPSGRMVAFLKQVSVWQPDPSRPVKELINPIYELRIATMDGTSSTRALTGVASPMWGSLVWSPDSTEVAVVGHAESEDSRERVFRCRVADGTCHPAIADELQLNLFARNMTSIPPYIWSGQHTLLIHGQRLKRPSQNSSEPEKWWIADSGVHARALFADFTASKEMPTQLISDRHGLITIINDRVWRVSDEGALIENLTPTLVDNSISIEAPQSTNFEAGTKLVLKAHRGGQDDFYLLDSETRKIMAIPKPSAEAHLAGFDAQGRTFVFSSNADTGTYLWLGGSERADFKTLLETNHFLQGIEEGKLKIVRYRDLDGRDSKGWIILPYGYRAGQRYPVIAWVYAGEVFGDEPPDARYLDHLNNPHPLNLQLLAAHGYVVLMPSMPSRPYGETGDPYLEFTKGVLPAIDKLIDDGIADSERVGVMGQSTGGYSTYGLITQTNRFKAAVALSGFSDLMSLYGTFDARLRFESTAHEYPFRMWYGEVLGMGSPPWMDMQRYIRNSPITYIERVNTPLLIMHGDLDFIPIQQGEEVFTALYRQNKRAEFVRYFGEDHVLTSPANIRDMWQRVYAWFDMFLDVHDERLRP